MTPAAVDALYRLAEPMTASPDTYDTRAARRAEQSLSYEYRERLRECLAACPDCQKIGDMCRDCRDDAAMDGAR